MIITPGEISITGAPHKWFGRDYHIVFSHFITDGTRDAVLDICDWGITMLQKEKALREAAIAQEPE